MHFHSSFITKVLSDFLYGGLGLCCGCKIKCCKPSTIEDSKEKFKRDVACKALSDLRVGRMTSSRQDEGCRGKDRLDSYDGRVMLIDKQVNGLIRLNGEHFERKRENNGYAISVHRSDFLRAIEREQVAARWPS